jgi:hypothetical protein
LQADEQRRISAAQEAACAGQMHDRQTQLLERARRRVLILLLYHREQQKMNGSVHGRLFSYLILSEVFPGFNLHQEN